MLVALIIVLGLWMFAIGAIPLIQYSEPTNLILFGVFATSMLKSTGVVAVLAYLVELLRPEVKPHQEPTALLEPPRESDSASYFLVAESSNLSLSGAAQRRGE